MGEKNWVVVESTIDETLAVHGPHTFEDARACLRALVKETNRDNEKNDKSEMTITPDGMSAVDFDSRIEVIEMRY